MPLPGPFKKILAPQRGASIEGVYDGWARGEYRVRQVIAYWPDFDAWEVEVSGYGYTLDMKMMICGDGERWSQLPPR